MNENYRFKMTLTVTPKNAGLAFARKIELQEVPNWIAEMVMISRYGESLQVKTERDAIHALDIYLIWIRAKMRNDATDAEPIDQTTYMHYSTVMDIIDAFHGGKRTAEIALRTTKIYE